MTKSTPTLTQSGLLAVLLQRQRYKVIELARRRAQRQQVRTAFLITLNRLLARAPGLTGRHLPPRPLKIPPPPKSFFTKAICHVSPNPHLHRTPATDSRRPADPTSRMGRAKWRMSHLRLLRVAPHRNARHFNANRTYRAF